MDNRLSLAFFVSTLLIGCSKSKNQSQDTAGYSNKLILAKNVILNSGEAFAAASNEIDTVTKIPAANVVFDVVSSSRIKSDNVQAALEEVSLNLSKVIIGTWNIENKDIGVIDSNHAATGRVTFREDGTFDLENGSFAAIGQGSSGFCSHVEDSQVWEKLSDTVLYIKHVNSAAQNSAVLKVLDFTIEKVVAYGQGGCGAGGKDRISILTKVQ